VIEVLHGGHAVYEIGGDVQRRDFHLVPIHVTLAFLPWPAAVVFSGLEFFIEGEIEARRSKAEWMAHLEEQRALALDSHIRNVIGQFAKLHNAGTVVYSPSQAERIGEIIKTIMEKGYWADYHLYPEEDPEDRVGHSRAPNPPSGYP
jgi:hypothetical protein